MSMFATNKEWVARDDTLNVKDFIGSRNSRHAFGPVST